MDNKRISVNISSGTARRKFHRKITPNIYDKSQKELAVASEFSKLCIVDGHNISNIRPNINSHGNAEDDHGKADVLCEINGKIHGIQLTELKYGAGVKRSNVEFDINEKLHKLITKSVKPSYPIEINIVAEPKYENMNNQVVKANDKDRNALAKAVIEGYNEGKIGPSIDEMLKSKIRGQYLTVPDRLKGKIKHIYINKISHGYTAYCQGKGNVYISTNFSCFVRDDETLSSLIQDIYESKKGGSADSLLVWCGDHEFWGDRGKIVNIMRDVFSGTSYVYVFLFMFVNIEPFFDADKIVERIK